MDFRQLSDLCTPWCVHVAATLRIADHLAAGITDIHPLAAAAGADPESLLRVLRHLSGKGLFEEPAPGRFALNEAARGLLEGPVRLALDLDSFGGRMAHAWGALLSAVRTGVPAYHEVFGAGFWEDLDRHPEIAAAFDRLMGPAGHGVPDPQVLVDPLDWERIRTVVDVGGGTGALLAEVLRTQPHVRGVLVDLPRTVACSGEVLRDVSERVTVVGQSFFEPLPPGGDLYLLKSVLSDWPDREAAAILKRCAEAAGGGPPAVRALRSRVRRPVTDREKGSDRSAPRSKPIEISSVAARGQTCLTPFLVHITCGSSGRPAGEASAAGSSSTPP